MASLLREHSFMDIFRSQKIETEKADKSSSKAHNRHTHSSCDTTKRTDMDSSVTINDETVLADQTSTTSGRSLHTVSHQLVNLGAGVDNSSDTSAPPRTVASSHVTETATKTPSRLFDLVAAGSPAARVSLLYGSIC